MPNSNGLAQYLLDLFQTLGPVGGLLLTAYTIHREGQARRIANLIAITERHGQIWEQLFQNPGLSRVRKRDVDLEKQPITEEERVFVKMLIVHLDTVRQAIKTGMFVRIDGLKQEIRDFFQLPIPRAVWESVKPYQNAVFVMFIETNLTRSVSKPKCETRGSLDRVLPECHG